MLITGASGVPPDVDIVAEGSQGLRTGKDVGLAGVSSHFNAVLLLQ